MKALVREEAGMTLLELMFACGVMGLALSFLFGSLVSVSIVGDLSEDQGLAVVHATSVFEEIQGLDFEQLKSYIPPALTGAGIGELVQVQCYTENGSPIQLPLSTGAEGEGEGEGEGSGEADVSLPNPVRVEVLVTWYDARGHVYTSSTSQLVSR
jgi:hypothetical protein